MGKANQAGRFCATYVNSGTLSVPIWLHAARISEVTRSQQRSTSDRFYRGKKNKSKVIGAKEHSISFKYAVKAAGTTAPVDTLLDKFEDSFDNLTILDIAMLNGTLDAGTTRVGKRGPFVVTKFDRNEPDEDGVTYDIELSEVDDDSATDPIPEMTGYQVVTAP